MALDTKEHIVEAGVAAFEQAEVKLRQAQKEILDLIPIFEAGNGLGMMGTLQTKTIVADLKVAAGRAAGAEAMIWRLHTEATSIAQDNGVDPPQPLGGGGR